MLPPRMLEVKRHQTPNTLTVTVDLRAFKFLGAAYRSSSKDNKLHIRNIYVIYHKLRSILLLTHGRIVYSHTRITRNRTTTTDSIFHSFISFWLKNEICAQHLVQVRARTNCGCCGHMAPKKNRRSNQWLLRPAAKMGQWVLSNS